MQINSLKQLTSNIASYCGFSEAVESNDVADRLLISSRLVLLRWMII